MKHILPLLIAILSSLNCMSETTFVGNWNGIVANIPIVFHISNNGDTWEATLDSPSQGAIGIPCGKVEVNADVISIDMPALRASFIGSIATDNNSITGTFTQGMAFTMTLTRSTEETPTINRPQEPKPPFDYNIEEVSFSHDGITLAGSLTYPKNSKAMTAVILISGSGAQNRDEEMLGHKPFAVIADYLTRHGIAVLRYDDRGVGGSTKGSVDDTTIDFAKDAMAAVKYLQSRPELTKIGLIGHSEGGTIALINAAAHPDDIDFIVTLAGPYVKGRDIIVRQNHLISETAGKPLTAEQSAQVDEIFNAIDNITDTAELSSRLKSIMSATGNHSAQEIEQSVKVMTSAWYTAFVRFDPAEYIAKITCPVLAINGDWDAQVDANQNLSVAATIPTATTRLYPRLNHMFQETESQSQSLNYGEIKQTISPDILTDITHFILNLK